MKQDKKQKKREELLHSVIANRIVGWFFCVLYMKVIAERGVPLFICIENVVSQKTYLLQTSRNVLQKAFAANSRIVISRMMLS